MRGTAARSRGWGRVVAHSGELAEIIAEFTDADGTFETAIPRVFLHRGSRISEPNYAIFDPGICILAQGRKRLFVGQNVLAYDNETYLVVSLQTPLLTEAVEASPDKPLLCAILHFQPAAIADLMIESDFRSADRESPGPAVTVSPLNDELLDAFVRLLRLLRSPHDIKVLGPVIETEILYRLLRSEQATRMSQIAFADSKLHRVRRAIDWIKRNFDKPMAVDTLAKEARLSRSALHKHFQEVTGFSPLQYQKRIRLQEAHRLLLGQGNDVATVSHAVGYESPTQFNREYKRLFGDPPHRHIARLKSRHGAPQ